MGYIPNDGQFEAIKSAVADIIRDGGVFREVDRFLTEYLHSRFGLNITNQPIHNHYHVAATSNHPTQAGKLVYRHESYVACLRWVFDQEALPDAPQ